jgi:hypothetical protein
MVLCLISHLRDSMMMECFGGLGIHLTRRDVSNVKPQPISPTAGAFLFGGEPEWLKTGGCLNFLQDVANPPPFGAWIRLVYYSHMLRP